MKVGCYMKKLLVACILFLIVLPFFFAGCLIEEQDTEGYVIRNDITMADLEFLYEGIDQRMDVTIEDMYGALGLPYSHSGHSVIEYSYRIKEGTIQFKFDNDKFLGARFYLLNNVPEPTPFEVGEVEIDQNQYKMKVIRDISEDEIEFIKKDTTSVEIQANLGAPHGSISCWDADTKTDVYYYILNSGNR